MTLSNAEKQSIVLDTAELIRMSGQSGRILRPAMDGVGSFAGPHPESETTIGDVPVEVKLLSPQERKQVGADLIASLLPDSDLKEDDVLVIDDIRYEVTDIRPENCFGAVSHLTVRLEREYKDTA